MKSIDNQTDYNELAGRINNLTDIHLRKWGKMTLQQMLVHYTTQLQIALSEIPGRLQGLWIMRTVLGKSIGLGKIPRPKGSATPREMNVEKNNFAPADIESEKRLLLHYLERVRSTESLQLHPFFGVLSKQEWRRLMYKHIDHHLKQCSE